MLGAMRRWPPSRPTSLGSGRASGTRCQWRAVPNDADSDLGKSTGRAKRRGAQFLVSTPPRWHRSAIRVVPHATVTRLRVEIIIVHAGLRCRPSNNPEGPDSTRPKPTYNGRWNFQSVCCGHACRALIGTSIFFPELSVPWYRLGEVPSSPVSAFRKAAHERIIEAV
jgi:hypothetical protein